MTAFWGAQGAGYKLGKTGAGGLPVLLLSAVLGSFNKYVAVGGKPVSGKLFKPLGRLVRKARKSHEKPQLHGSCHFVYVLSAMAAAAHEFFLERTGGRVIKFAHG